MFDRKAAFIVVDAIPQEGFITKRLMIDVSSIVFIREGDDARVGSIIQIPTGNFAVKQKPVEIAALLRDVGAAVSFATTIEN